MAMTQEQIVKELQDAGALLTGHFKLRSGKHSNRFFQCALVFVDPHAANVSAPNSPAA